MLKLEDIKKDAQIRGIQADEIVRVVQVEPVGENALTVYYKDSQGRLSEQMLFRSDEPRLELAQAGRPWAFDAPGADFKLGLEAYRISQAALFDPMMAVHTSNVEPLPHQISAVYESMLPRQPLRFVLADDPGAGKTIMAGLLISELLMRADAKRILIVSPGGLTEQWQDELLEKFGVQFEIFSREKQEQCASGNYFDEADRLICRLDQLSRNEDYQEKLKNTQWDLIIVDEAHKLSANYFGNKVNKTKRFLLGELLGSITRHFLLMTATPHNGILMSISTRLISSCSRNISRASRPFWAQNICIGRSFKMISKYILLIFSSSAIRIFLPRKRSVSVTFSFGDLACSGFAGSYGIIKVNTLPFPTWDFTDTEPSSRSRSPFVMARPKPVPSYFR